tara:strand:- start:432 stop:635 length:204 start_codon:yes stop_codon:yes gene_type:complete
MNFCIQTWLGHFKIKEPKELKDNMSDYLKLVGGCYDGFTGIYYRCVYDINTYIADRCYGSEDCKLCF